MKIKRKIKIGVPPSSDFGAAPAFALCAPAFAQSYGGRDGAARVGPSGGILSVHACGGNVYGPFLRS